MWRDARRHAARWLQEGALYLLLLLLPFSKSTIEVAFVCLLIGWGVSQLDPATRAQSPWRLPAFRPLLISLGAFLAVCALSIAVSGHPALSARGLVSKWGEYALMLVLAADLAAKPGVMRRGRVVLIISLLLVMVESFSQELLGKGLLRGYALSTFDRMTGPYENPIDLATYFIVMIPILMALTLKKGSWWLRVWYGVLLIVSLGCLARTEALGAWMGLVVGLLSIVIWRNAPMRRAAPLIGLLVLLASGYALYHVGRLDDAFSLSEVGKTERTAMWRTALGMIRDRPILGHGLNTFMANYMAYRVGGEPLPTYAHNCYLQTAAEIGFIGLAAFLWMLWCLVTRLTNGIKQAEGNSRLLLTGLFIGLVAFLAQSAVDTNFYTLRQATYFWTLSGLALGLSAQAEHPS